MQKLIKIPHPFLKKCLSFLGVILMMQSLTACSTTDVNDYGDSKLVLKPQVFFDGQLKAYGVVKDYKGEVIRHFSADIAASWKDDVGTLDEDFVFSDGEKQKRIWTLKPTVQGIYFASANDVVGEHAMSVAGNALFMEYVLQLPYKGKTMNVKVDDKMFLVDEKRIINESIFYKWGVKVASVQLVIEKL